MKHRLLAGAIITFALAACAPAIVETETDTNADVEAESSFEAQVGEILSAAYADDGPGVAVIITKDNETIFIGAQGMADIEAGQPIADTTVFRLASITKQFSAATLLLLAEDGLVDLDAPLSTYLPDYPEPGASIPVRRLLNHTSGIPSYTSIPGWMVEANTAKEHSTEEMIALFSGLPQDFEPGERFAYNNSGYVLVGAVIEAVTGDPWADVVKSRISDPLGLSDLQSGLEEATVAGMAKGYTNAERPTGAQRIHMTVPHAAGALISDVQNLADWANALHDGDVLSAESYAAMIAPTVLNDGSEIDYGYGIGTSEIYGQPTIGHNGGIFGFSTDSVYLPSEDIFVGVLGNSDSFAVSPGTTAIRLAALAAGTPAPVHEQQETDLSALEPLFGIYASDEVTRTFFSRGDQVFTYRQNGVEAEVFSAGDDTFFYGQNSLTWFEIDGEADPKAMIFYSGASLEPETLFWTGPVPAEIKVAADLLETYLGTYALNIGPMAEIAAADGGLEQGITIQVTGQPAFLLEPLSETEFEVRSVGALIRFLTNDDGSVSMEIEQGGGTFSGTRTGD